MILILKSIIAGMFIAFGASVYMHIGGVAGAVLFSMGLLTICLCQYKLFTGVVGYVHSKVDVARSMVILLGNFVGSFAVLGISDPMVANTIVTAKLSTPWQTIFVRAVFCGMIIYSCVDIFKRDKLKGMLYIPFGVSVFILIGAEHSIADMCYFIATRTIGMKMVGYLVLIIVGNALGSMLLERAKGE